MNTRKAVFGLLTALALSWAPAVYAADNNTEFGIADDLSVFGTGGTMMDPDMEVKGFSLFGSTSAQTVNIPQAPGNIFVSGYVQISSGLYVAGTSTFTGTVNLPAPTSIAVVGGNDGQVMTKNGATGFLQWSNVSALVSGDNLGNHIATATLNMASWDIVNVSSVNYRANVFTSSASAAQNGGLYVSTHVYIAGQVQIAGGSPGTGKVLISDANGLASWANTSAVGDNLGNHLATTTLDLDTFDIKDAGYITASSEAISGQLIVYGTSTLTGNTGVGGTLNSAGLITAAAGLAVTGGNATVTNSLTVNGNAKLGNDPLVDTHGINQDPEAGVALAVSGPSAAGSYSAKFYSGGSLAAWIKQK